MTQAPLVVRRLDRNATTSLSDLVQQDRVRKESQHAMQQASRVHKNK